MHFGKFILNNLLRRKVRTSLTAMGIAVAITAVVGLVGISLGFKRAFASTYESRGVDLIVVRSGVTEYMTSNLDESVGSRLAKLSGVQRVAADQRDVVSFDDDQSAASQVPLLGWQPGSFLLEKLKFQSGGAASGERKCVLLGHVLAERLGKKVGDTVRIKLKSFRVRGIFDSFNPIENGSAIVPLADLQELTGKLHKVTSFQIVLSDDLKDEADVEGVQRRIEALRDEKGQKLGLQAMTHTNYTNRATQILLAEAMAKITSTIALVIGTIGILNTMITSVLERTREIGVLRAIGWRKWRVVRMILAEALALAGTGGVIGIVAAVILTKALSQVAVAGGVITGTLDLGVIGGGFLLALSLGVVGGAYPAWRGAQLLPTEALRHD